jgi:hypothetical protein
MHVTSGEMEGVESAHRNRSHRRRRHSGDRLGTRAQPRRRALPFLLKKRDKKIRTEVQIPPLLC